MTAFHCDDLYNPVTMPEKQNKILFEMPEILMSWNALCASYLGLNSCPEKLDLKKYGV